MFEWWIQDSPIKGLRLQKFKVDPKNSQILIWIEGDGKEISRYGRKELIENLWVLMEKED